MAEVSTASGYVGPWATARMDPMKMAYTATRMSATAKNPRTAQYREDQLPLICFGRLIVARMAVGL